MTATMRRRHWSELRDRELEVLRHAADGLTCIETGRALFIEPQTVKFHRTNIIRKLQAKSITHAVGIAYENGLFIKAEERNEIVVDGVRFVRSDSQPDLA